MKRSLILSLTLLTFLAGGCSSRSTPTPPLDLSTGLGARDDGTGKPVDPALSVGDIKKASEEEQKRFIKLQHERMKQQQDEVDDLRRQKFQDGYYESRYPDAGQ